MKKAIIYSSITGNTKKVAESLYAIDPKNTALLSVDEVESVDDYNMLILGFWVDRGTADKKMLSVMDKISEKRVGFFGTLGAYPDSDHAKKVTSRVIEKLEENNNKVLETFLCQGKVDDKLKERMHQFPKDHPHYPNEARLKRWAEADKHPNQEDFINAKEKFKKLLSLEF